MSCFRRLAVHITLPLCFFDDTATTEIYTLSLHDALPISKGLTVKVTGGRVVRWRHNLYEALGDDRQLDRKSTRLNSSHTVISYAVFCLKKKKRGLVAPVWA